MLRECPIFRIAVPKVSFDIHEMLRSYSNRMIHFGVEVLFVHLHVSMFMRCAYFLFNVMLHFATHVVEVSSDK